MTEAYIQGVVAEIEREINRMSRIVDYEKASTDLIENLSLNEKNILLKNIRLVPDGSGFHEGWISERNPDNKPQVRPYAFMSFDDLALNIFYLRTAFTLATSPTEQVRQSVIHAIRAQTGEAWEEGRPLSEHWKKHFGLEPTSDLLLFASDEIATWGEMRRKDLADKIISKIELLEVHRDNPQNWHKLGKRNFRYTFVPLSFLP